MGFFKLLKTLAASELWSGEIPRVEETLVEF
jgi:hypothetical protein